VRHPPKLFASEMGGATAFNMEYGQDVVCDDGVILHTQYSTQWDSLAHWGQLFDADGDGVPEPVYYNGFRAGTDLKAPANGEGPFASKLGIENLATAGVQGRGVLVDLRAIHGTADILIGCDLLTQAIDAQKVDVQQGDFLILYTGFDRVLLDMKREPIKDVLDHTGSSLDGMDKRLHEWIDQSGIVAICSDNIAVESMRYMQHGAHGHSTGPLHELCLFKLGIHLGELWYLEELADWLRANGRSAFQLTAPPLRLPGSVGSPVTPIAAV
jgi:kynurenine formamidase